MSQSFLLPLVHICRFLGPCCMLTFFSVPPPSPFIIYENKNEWMKLNEWMNWCLVLSFLINKMRSVTLVLIIDLLLELNEDVSAKHISLWVKWEQSWRGVRFTCLPPMWREFDSELKAICRLSRLVPLCSAPRGLSPGAQGFPFLLKTKTWFHLLQFGLIWILLN